MQGYCDNKKIVHIINRDKFTKGYIEFMQQCIPEYNHEFFLLEKGFQLELTDRTSIIYLKTYKDLMFSQKVKSEILSCDKIIVSGVFGIQNYMVFYPQNVWKKTYLHFWGGDFYQYRNNNYKNVLKKIILKQCIKKSAALIMLIEGEYDEFVKIIGVEKKNFLGPMPGSPNQKIDYKKYRKENSCSKKRILVGNSSTKENQHIQVFHILKDRCDENVEVCCPLSYGDMQYREEVLNAGNEILGKSFKPILDYMEKEEYIKFLATCDVGIFNNNRQQAMGNIWALIRLGKKVYLRDDTSMWSHFESLGFKVHSITDLEKNSSLEEILYLDTNTKEKNYEIADKGIHLVAVENWKKVFEDLIE